MARVSFETGLRVVITGVVGAIGAAIGFTHTRVWAEANGQHGLVAYGIAVVIESMAVVAGLELRRRYGHGPLFVLVAAFVLQMAAQVAGARDTFAGWLLAATPALGFLVIVKFGLRAAADAEQVRPVESEEDRQVSTPVQVERPETPVVDAEVREIEPAAPAPEVPAEPEPVAAVTSPWG
jgi:hypothetical protein